MAASYFVLYVLFLISFQLLSAVQTSLPRADLPDGRTVLENSKWHASRSK